MTRETSHIIQHAASKSSLLDADAFRLLLFRVGATIIDDSPNPSIRLVPGGGSLTVQWAPVSGEGSDIHYQVLIGEATATDPATFTIVTEFPANTNYVKQTAWWTRRSARRGIKRSSRGAKAIEVKDDTAYAVATATA